jgi:uncharacterized protein YqeY
MSIRERLESDVKQAMKSREATRLQCLRMLKSKIQEREVALRADKGRDHKLGDQEVQQVIASYAKQRRDSIEGYEKGGRQDLVAAERAELEIVEQYLPKQLSEDEVKDIVKAAIAETGVGDVKQIGSLMRVVMPRVKGVADGKLVQRLARELLG